MFVVSDILLCPLQLFDARGKVLDVQEHDLGHRSIMTSKQDPAFILIHFVVFHALMLNNAPNTC